MTSPAPGSEDAAPDEGAGADDGPAVDEGSVPEGGRAADEGAPGGGPKPSGLRNPAAAVRGLGAGTLALEAIVLLLAIQPIRIFAGDLSGWGVGAVVALAVLAIVLAGCMGRSWGWTAGTVLQVLLLASGLLHWSLAAIGVIFAATWAYATYVRRRILG